MQFDFPKVCLSYSLHNHSNFSDGANSLEDMCKYAKSSGIKVFGISDHWVIHPNPLVDASSWAMNPDLLPAYVAELQRLKSLLEDESFSLKIGLEVDFFYENISDVLDYLSNFPFDYLIGSVHFSGNFPIDHDIKDWLDLTENEKVEICNIYYDKLAGAAACKAFSFIGHLDLPKKFGLIDNNQYLSRAYEILDVLEKNNMSIELNTAGWFKECKEQYPAYEILQKSYERKIPVVVSADAHYYNHVNRNFNEANNLLRKANYIMTF